VPAGWAGPGGPSRQGSDAVSGRGALGEVTAVALRERARVARGEVTGVAPGEVTAVALGERAGVARGEVTGVAPGEVTAVALRQRLATLRQVITPGERVGVRLLKD
jgi:hypothetical protein